MCALPVTKLSDCFCIAAITQGCDMTLEVVCELI
jgi:hypothetical protein